MKVGVLLNNLSPVSGGGYTFQNTVFQSLLKFQTKHNFVILGHMPPVASGQANCEHLDFIPFPKSISQRVMRKFAMIATGLVNIIPILPDLCRGTNWLQQAIRRHKIEIMWFVDPFYIEIDAPYVFTVWDLQHRLQPCFPEVGENKEWNRRERMYAVAIPRATAVIVGTEAGKKEVVNFYRVPPERIAVIPHPTPDFALSGCIHGEKDILTKYNIPEKYLFYPAQFWPHKNHIGLLSAIELLREKYRLIFPIVFAGSDKGNLPYVRRMAKEFGVAKQVHFLGFVPEEDLVKLYRNAFALVYPSFFGPENLPPLEAFALGCPVIASDVAGAQEQLGNAALLVNPKNSHEIALAIKTLHDNDELRKTLIQRGLNRARRWTGQNFVTSVVSLLDDLEPIRRCWSS